MSDPDNDVLFNAFLPPLSSLMCFLRLKIRCSLIASLMSVLDRNLLRISNTTLATLILVLTCTPSHFRPEEHQPSGTCNFSRIDNATLQLVLSNATVEGTKTAKVRVYATNYNVLRVMSGTGGLAYSN